ncbi:DJ-1/PfpI family protein [Sporomusa malonica]|uniref:DJ-1/PfpI family protein n=1 Tax=Sporomusa malonica TaxID=112901 RepID=A0A1W1ZKU8_9FIRM|nr:DJ-1/PfpI family protein [Sporomusa malonica]SMC49175.1 DJ-1/PfpI family protein [Sporomusa malonica]
MAQQLNVGILLFNEVEVLDFAGPFEVFSITTSLSKLDRPFAVHIISQTGEMVSARNGLMVKPSYSIADAPALDILIIPGGYGAEEIEIHNEIIIDWIRKQSTKVKLLASVCTGAFLLAKAGLLDGKKATTHWMDIERLAREYPQIDIQQGQKYVDEGSIITAAGISAGLDMSFHIIKKLLGPEIARATAKRMEYDIVIAE